MKGTSRSGLGSSRLTYSSGSTNAAAQVIGNDSRPIGGLYAAGECIGGILGDFYVGSGNALASAQVFGRTAGRVVGGMRGQR